MTYDEATEYFRDNFYMKVEYQKLYDPKDNCVRKTRCVVVLPSKSDVGSFGTIVMEKGHGAVYELQYSTENNIGFLVPLETIEQAERECIKLLEAAL